jgi:hypothetical protein
MTATDYPISYKFNRANKHLNELHRTIVRFLGGRANGVVHDYKSEPGYLIVRAYSRKKPPPSCSGLIGEVLYHYRAALDYFACELARHNKQVVDDNVEFPIFIERDKFRNPVTGKLTPGIVKRIGKLRDDHQALIEEEQPFQGRHGKPEDDPLWLLYRLSNFDRHQFIHLTSVVVNASVQNFTPTEAAARFEQVSVRYGAFEREAEVARFRILPVPTALEVNVDSNVRFDVSFDDKGPGAGRPVLSTLGGIGVRAGELVQRFLPLL